MSMFVDVDVDAAGAVDVDVDAAGAVDVDVVFRRMSLLVGVVGAVNPVV